MHYFRTQTGIEVDVILENADGEIIGIEIKSGEKFDTHDFKGLKYLQEKVGDEFVKGIILYAGTEVIPYGRSLIALPITFIMAKYEHRYYSRIPSLLESVSGRS